MPAVVHDLIEAIIHPNESAEDQQDQLVCKLIPMAASIALKNTVGAKQILLNSDQTKPDMVAAFKRDLQHYASDPTKDEVLRDDARKYLAYIGV